ncbi:MAG: hypothetical protein GX447_09230 [Elusimicrobia bacterium]|nr:hypothetical protein [Elusimicrobiota bacterium]
MIDKLRQLEQALNEYISQFDAVKKENVKLKKELEKIKAEKAEEKRKSEEKIAALKEEFKRKISDLSAKIERYLSGEIK